jgi:uncharacterized protein YndB with AHSA1/START domain
VTHLDAPRRLAYTWKSDKVDTFVEWTLQPTPSGTRVELVHSGFKGIGQTILRKFMMGPGWARMLEKVLPGVIARVGPDGFAAGSPKARCAHT